MTSRCTATFATVLKWSVVLATICVSVGCGRESREADDVPAIAGTVTSPDGVAISYEVHGTGLPAVVFIHGWSCDRSYWEGQLQPFSRKYQVVAIDLAGHGASGLGRQSWTIGAFGADVAAVVKKLGLQRIVLIGHSMGGDVIMEAARRSPGRVEGLVWIDTYKQLGKPRTPDREVTVALQELHLPVVAINSDNPPTDFESMDRFGVDVVLMPGAGHFPMMEDPRGFNRRLSEVLDKLVR